MFKNKLITMRSNAEKEVWHYYTLDKPEDLRWHLLKIKFDITNKILKVIFKNWIIIAH